MEVNSKQILEDINHRIRCRDIFKYNRELLIESLIIAINRTLNVSFYKTLDLMYVNQVVDQYRTILKFIHSVDNEHGQMIKNKDIIIDCFCKMIIEFIESYTPVRNYLDQCIIGTRIIEYDEKNNKYIENSFNDFSNYSRMIDKYKEYPSEDNKENVIEKMMKYLNLKKFKINLIKDRYLSSLIVDYENICWSDSEIKFDFDFGDFKYSDLISFCAALKLIADYNWGLMIRYNICYIDCEYMNNVLTKFSNLPRETVEYFLNFQIYDYSYQKDKLTLLQGLLKCGDKYYFNPITLNIGLLPMKMFRLLYDFEKGKYRSEFSKISNLKEKQMTDAIIQKLKKYDIQIETNYIIKKEKKPIAEYDMLVFDNITNNLYIIEFKWHFVGDGEKEHKDIDDKLEIEIAHRIEKDKFIIDDVKKICLELFNKSEVSDIKELLISQNYSGMTKHDMTIIDYETLQWSVERHESFKGLMDYFLSNEYRKSIDVYNKKFKISVEGYNFDIYRICYK